MTKELKTAYDKIKRILKTHPQARYSDAKLYALYTGHPEIESILKETNYETIRRNRAQIFRDFPDLKPPEGSDIDSFRKEREISFKNFFLKKRKQQDLF